MKDRIFVGTRRSPLALAQARQTVEALQRLIANVRYEIVAIQTRGDKMREAGGTGIEGKRVFTREIEEALIRGDIDVAIHSMKDVAAELPEGLVIAAVPERADPRDVLISRSNATFEHLPKGACIGTSSPRRKAQLLAARRDLQVVDMHGNVGTRMRKLANGECDAIVLAAAGLVRLGLTSMSSEFFSPDTIIPAIGQGALAIQSREHDSVIRRLVSHLDHEPTRTAILAERSFARRLGANCRVPVAAYARTEADNLKIDGMVADPSGSLLIRDKVVSNSADPEDAGEKLAQTLLDRGARAILRAS